MKTLYFHSQKQIVSTGGLILLGLALVACGSGKKAACETVLETIYATEEQLARGVQTPETLNTNAEYYKTLATELEALELQNEQLHESVENLATAYSEHAASWLATAEVTTAEGTIRGEEAYRKSAARELRSQNQIQLHTDRLIAACR
ncbi:MAG: hypothetical protein AAFX01_10030 [Cyanobacteria bacterium J06638_28]